MKNLKTKFEEIVNVEAIGKSENPISMNDLLEKALAEDLNSVMKDTERVLVLAIDQQKDFMEGGSLGVPGSLKDTENFTRFIYNNMEKITKIIASIDTHAPFQIFFKTWFVDENDNYPDYFTVISYEDLCKQKWRPVFNLKETLEYVKHLELVGKKQLIIWPFHCLEGSDGCSLENQFLNMVYFHEVARRSKLTKLVKGKNPCSEMYGVFKPEYDPNGLINTDLLNAIEKYDKIFIGGQAKSHCVMESLLQILEHYSTRPDVTSKIFILEDCMSSIQGYEKETEDKFNELRNKYKINLVKSTEVVL